MKLRYTENIFMLNLRWLNLSQIFMEKQILCSKELNWLDGLGCLFLYIFVPIPTLDLWD